MGNPFADLVFAVVDCETTGLGPERDRIIEIAVLTVRGDGGILSRWSTLVRPDDRPLEGRLSAVIEAPTFAEVAGAVCGELSKGIVVGHNVGFDLRMIDAELRRAGVCLPTVTYVDTHRAATFLSVDTPNRSLAVLCDAMGVEFGRWHTAEGDAEATAALTVKLLNRAADWGHTDLRHLEGLWTSSDSAWPTLPIAQRLLVRDPATFPPSGKQPGHPAVFRPSWRRYGDGRPSATTSSENPQRIVISLDDQTVRTTYLTALRKLIDESDTSKPWPESWEPEWAEWAEHIRLGGENADEAAAALLEVLLEREDEREPTPVEKAIDTLISDDLHGLQGIATLERVVAALEGAEDEVEYYIQACTRLADLYRLHGGRDADVVTSFQRAFDAGKAWCERTSPPADTNDDIDWPAMAVGEVVDAWWDYTAPRRDIVAFSSLFGCTTAPSLRYVPGNRPARHAAYAIGNYAIQGELPVAEQIFRTLLPMWPTNDGDLLAIAVERVCFVLARESRTDEALHLCNEAWTHGWINEALANRHSLILERLHRYDEAARVAEMGLDLPPHHDRDALIKRIGRCRAKPT